MSPGGLSTAIALWLACTALVVVIIGVRRPEWAVCLLVILAFTNGAAALGSQNLLPAALALLFGVAAVLRRSWRTTDTLLPFLALAGLYVSFSAVSMLWSADPEVAQSSVIDLGFTVALAAGIVASVSRMEHLRWAVWSIIGACTLVGAISLVQFATGAFTADVFGLAQADFEQIAGPAHAFRSGGPFADANFFGQVMVVSLALSLERARAAATWTARVLALGAGVVAGATIGITYSRGALLAAVVVIIIALIRMTNRALALSIAVLALVGIGSLAPADYAARLAQLPSAVGLSSAGTGSVSDPAILGRTSSWVVAGQLAADNPIAGVGYGNYRVEYLERSGHVGIDWRGEPRAPHSLPLQVLAEQGMIGLLLLGAVIAGAFVSLRSARRRLSTAARHGREHAVDPSIWADRSLLGGISDALVGYLVASVFLHAAHPAVFWVLLALGWAADQVITPHPPGALVRMPARERVSAGSGHPPRRESPPESTLPR